MCIRDRLWPNVQNKEQQKHEERYKDFLFQLLVVCTNRRVLFDLYLGCLFAKIVEYVSVAAEHSDVYKRQIVDAAKRRWRQIGKNVRP